MKDFVALYPMVIYDSVFQQFLHYSLFVFHFSLIFRFSLFTSFYKQALISPIKSGCGLSSLELNSGWDWVAT